MEIVFSNDGSNTIFSSEFDEFYHSPRGAISESNYVYIKNGLEEYIKRTNSSSISIFELGFGTGLNALLSYQFASKNNLKINYTSIEKNPIDPKTLEQLSYYKEYKADYKPIIEAEWGKLTQISNNFHIKKIHSDIINYQTNEKYNIIYFDAFAKSKQSEIWSNEIISKMSEILYTNGNFVTYASTSQLKKQLKTLKFNIIKTKGALGKREMTLAIKT